MFFFNAVHFRNTVTIPAYVHNHLIIDRTMGWRFQHSILRLQLGKELGDICLNVSTVKSDDLRSSLYYLQEVYKSPRKRWHLPSSIYLDFYASSCRSKQCSGSMTFWCGSGSADPCLWLMGPDPYADPDPAIFVIDPEDANKKLFF